MMFDVCIVGSGITGSAAARWAAQQPDIKVCLIGASEPTEQEWDSSSRQIFGAHYDEHRIITALDNEYPYHNLHVLNSRSAARFRDLEKQSGIQFYQDIGVLHKYANDAIQEIWKDLSKTIPMALLSGDEFLKNLPTTCSPFFKNIEDGRAAIFEKGFAGCINPRKYIAANERIASKHGCNIVHEVVTDVTESSTNEDGAERYATVTTESGREVRARRVLLCTGAFANFKGLLPKGMEVDITLTTERVALVEVEDKDIERLSTLPCCISDYDDKINYFTPVARFPDGKFYIKVGHGHDLNRPLLSEDDVISWYRLKENAPRNEVNDLVGRLFQTLKDFEPKSVSAFTCVITTTPTRRYYCDMVSTTLGIVTGGNGYGATVGDEVGRMAALMITHGQWKHDFPAELFRVQYKNKNNGNAAAPKLK